MKVFNLKKHRDFDLSSRLHGTKNDAKRIEFDRLPRKRVRPIWWYFLIFVLVYALYQYLR